MNKLAIVLTILLVISVSGYLYFDKYFDLEEISEWDFITEQSVLVIEIQNQNNLYSYLRNSQESVLSHLLSYPFEPSVDILNSDSSKLKKASKIYITLQKIGHNKIGSTYIFDLSNKSLLPNKMIEILSNQTVTREYLNEKIYKYSSDNLNFEYYIKENYLVVSSNSLLIEDVIRARYNDDLKLFKDTNPKLFTVPKLINDIGNIYINLTKFNDLLGIFMESNVENNNKIIASNSFYDFNIDSNEIIASGFTFTKKEDFLNTFIGQVPIEDPFDYYIPLNAISASKYLVSNSTSWFSNLNEYWKNLDSKYLNERFDFNKIYEFDNNRFISLIDKGIAKVDLLDGPKLETLVYISVSDKSEFLSRLNILSESISKAKGDSIFSEVYGEYTIVELNIKDFPKYLLGPQFDGFSTTYYFNLNDNIIFGTSINAIKALIQSIENEKTWGRQIGYVRFFNNGLDEFNYSYTLDIQRFWPLLFNKLNEKWKPIFNESEEAIKSYRLGSIQYSRIDNSFYSNLIIEKRNNNSISRVNNQLEINQNLSFTTPITSAPFVVKNHNSNLFETLVQDSLNNLSLISSDGNRLWSIKLEGKLSSDIYQIDFYKNGKLQYFLSTNKKVYIIDRLGHLVENYPLNASFEINDARVIDYNNSKDYRFLILSTTGEIYLFNKHGNQLEGWNPLLITGEHCITPFHLRVRGKDLFITLLKDGTLSLYNRRGESFKGFPVNLKDRFETDVFVESGADMSNSFIHLISKGGKLYKVSLTGLVANKEELFKESKDTKFKIVPDALNTTYLISRNDQHRLVLLDKNKEEIFAKDYLGSDGLLVQYYYFSPEHIIYAITDTEQGFTYLYRGNGELVNSQPINSEGKIGLIFSESAEEYTLYSTSESSYQQMKFK